MTRLTRLIFAGVVLVMKLGPALTQLSTKPFISKEWLDNYPYPTKNLRPSPSKSSNYDDRFSDPKWKEQWYMLDYRTQPSPVMDHNIVPVFNAGYTGQDVVIAILGDGIDSSNTDLTRNVLASKGYDACKNREVSTFFEPEMGTRAAGIIAMQPNNNFCGVGIAYDAHLIGVELMCDGRIDFNDYDARAFKYMSGDVHIYTILTEIDAPFFNLNREVANSLANGIKEGRNKKGAIYIVSAGNHKSVARCSTDALVNNPATIAIASASREGKVTGHSEICTAVFATAYTGSDAKDGFITTSSNSCDKTDGSSSFITGPSVASGIIALALQANDKLTYRDIMHLIAVTSEVAPLADNKDTWIKNGAGFWVSPDFGFGLLNAWNLVSSALHWKNVGPEKVCVITGDFVKPKTLKAGSFVHYEVFDLVCKGTYQEVNFVEFIEVIADIDFPKEYALSISLFTPASYFKQTILGQRISTPSSIGTVSGWRFKTVQNWGENPRGRWTVNISADAIPDDRFYSKTTGSVKKITLVIHGTKEKPNHYLPRGNNRRTYSSFRLPNYSTS